MKSFLLRNPSKIICILTMLYFCPAYSLANDKRIDETIEWKKYVISPENDERVNLAQQVFQRLLYTWDDFRIMPVLKVIDKPNRPWAAAFADGTILLTLSAIDICLQKSAREGKSKLAFVLSHELVHLRSDDLWHQRFFHELERNGNETHIGSILFGESNRELENKEMRADAEGLILMTMMGYDPLVIVGNPDFYSTWLETSLKISCKSPGSLKNKHLCQLVDRRIHVGRQQLERIAGKSLLFELGMQRYIVGDYASAKQYFSTFARNFPGHSVFTNIGLSYLGEAISYRQQLLAMNAWNDPAYMFPLKLGALGSEIFLGATQYRSDSVTKKEAKDLMRFMTESLKAAIQAFEKVLKLSPNDAQGYIHLISAYLMDQNLPMAKGILEGKYIAKFGEDNTTKLLTAIIAAIQENDHALDLFEQLTGLYEESTKTQNTERTLFHYLIYYNIAQLYKAKEDNSGEMAQWQRLAKLAQRKGDALLFQLSLKHMNMNSIPVSNTHKVPFPGVFIGEIIPKSLLLKFDKQKLRSWIGEDQLQEYQSEEQVKLVINNKRKVLSVWKDNDRKKPGIDKNIKSNASLFLYKRYGIPSRQVSTERGEYFAYDNLGVAYNIVENEIAGWFYYEKTQFD